MKNCILVGIGADESKLRTKENEILFATESESLLFSDSKIFHNGNEVGSLSNELAVVFSESLRALT